MAIQLMKAKILLVTKFYAARDSYYYLLVHSDILENIVDLNHKGSGGI